MSEYKLTQGILRLSSSSTWELAKRERRIEAVYDSDEPETCLCGHFPIIEVCTLKNQKTKNEVIVGNCCVKKFIGLPSGKIFASIKRVKKDDRKSLSIEVIEYARSRNWITEWEKTFSIDTVAKRNLSEKQMQKRQQINTKVLKNLKVKPH